MALETIPLNPDSNPFYEVSVELEGNKYYLTFNYNYRADAWYMDISDVNKEVIVAGTRLRSDFPPLLQFEDERLPVGFIVIVNLSQDGTDPTLDSLGTKHILTYDSEITYLR